MFSRRNLELTPEEQIVYDKREAGMSIKKVMELYGLSYSQVTNRYTKARKKVATRARVASAKRRISF